MKNLYLPPSLTQILIVSFLFTALALPQTTLKNAPINVSCRLSAFEGSYVLIVQNLSAENLDLWLRAKGKLTELHLTANSKKEIGWAQGFKFDANNHFYIWGNGYDTLHQTMPEKELSPWRIGFADGGLALSLSKYLLQSQLEKHLTLPMKKKALKAIDIEMNHAPIIVLKEGSERIYANVKLQPSLLHVNLSKPITVSASFIPYYKQANGQICATQIRVEEMLLDDAPNDLLNNITPAVNALITELFSSYVMYQIENSFLIKLAKVVNLRGKVLDGRLEIVIL